MWARALVWQWTKNRLSIRMMHPLLLERTSFTPTNTTTATSLCMVNCSCCCLRCPNRLTAVHQLLTIAYSKAHSRCFAYPTSSWLQFHQFQLFWHIGPFHRQEYNHGLCGLRAPRVCAYVVVACCYYNLLSHFLCGKERAHRIAIAGSAHCCCSIMYALHRHPMRYHSSCRALRTTANANANILVQ